MPLVRPAHVVSCFGSVFAQGVYPQWRQEELNLHPRKYRQHQALYFSTARLKCLLSPWCDSRDLRISSKTGGLGLKADVVDELSKALCLFPQCLHLCISGALLRPSSNWH